MALVSQAPQPSYNFGSSPAGTGSPTGAGAMTPPSWPYTQAGSGAAPRQTFSANQMQPGSFTPNMMNGGSSAAPGSGWTPYYATGAPAANDAMASASTGMPQETSPTLSSIFSGLSNGTDALNATSSFNNNNSALNTMSGLGYNDMGIPQNVREMMKTQAAQSLNPQYQAQKQAAQRMAAKMGLTGDSAAAKGEQGIEQSRIGAVTGAQQNIDISSAQQAQQEYLQNLQATAQGQQNQSAADEASRQFNVGAGLDTARFGTAQAEAEDRMRLNRASMNESASNWLQDYEMRRQRLGAGLADSAQTAANQQSSQFLQSLYGPMTYGTGTGNTFASM